MRRSLSLILPVRNAQSTLNSTIEYLLESLSDQTSYLEVILIDDGSTDDTAEVVFEMVERYPQIKAVYNDIPCGWRESVMRGLEVTSGEMLLIWEENCRLSIDSASRLFVAADHCPLILGTVRPIRWPHRWIGWRQSGASGGFRLIIPELLEEYGHSAEMVYEFATEKINESVGWRLIPVADCAHGLHERLEEGHYYRRSDAHDPVTSGRLSMEHRPNFLRQVREFALGE